MRQQFPKEIERHRVFGKPNGTGSFRIYSQRRSLIISVKRASHDNPWDRVIAHRVGNQYGHYKKRYQPTIRDMGRLAKLFWGEDEPGPAMYFNCPGDWSHSAKKGVKGVLWRSTMVEPSVPPEHRWKE